MSNTGIRSKSSNHCDYAAADQPSSGPGALVVHLGFLLGIIVAFVDELQRKSDPRPRHARWGARW